MSQPRLETQTAQPYVKGSEYPMTLVYSDEDIIELVARYTGKGFIQGKKGHAFIDRKTGTLVLLTAPVTVGEDGRITANRDDFIQKHLTQTPMPAPIAQDFRTVALYGSELDGYCGADRHPVKPRGR